MRLAPRVTRHAQVFALVRREESAEKARALDITPLWGDLSDAGSLARLALGAQVVFHFAPPPTSGLRDTHTRNLLAALSPIPPARLIYISTTGVYGDCAGMLIDETRVVNPTTDRALRRVDAETVLRQWGARRGVCVSILRAAGIYSAQRLPLARIASGTPTLRAEDDVFTNHIHADDLAHAACRTMHMGRANRVYNIVDQSSLMMGDYVDLVADHYALARPRRVTRLEAEQMLDPAMMSFLRESRQIDNRRMRTELGLRLTYPRVADFLLTQRGA